MAIKAFQNIKISGGGKSGGRKEIGSAIRQKRANRGSINIKEMRARMGHLKGC